MNGDVGMALLLYDRHCHYIAVVVNDHPLPKTEKGCSYIRRGLATCDHLLPLH